MAKAKFVSTDEFKAYIKDLFLSVVQKGDERAAALQATVNDLSAKLTTANQTIVDLQAAIDGANAAKATELAAQAASQLGELDTMSTELASEFNPTPTADAVAEVVTESPVVETPVEVSSSETINTSEPTPEPVVVAAVDAIAEQASDFGFE